MVLGRLFGKPAVKPALKPLSLTIDDQVIAIALRRNAKAKRLTLRMNRSGDGAVLTMPLRASVVEAARFVETSKLWVANQLLKVKPSTIVSDGSVVTFQGEPHKVSAIGGTRGLVHLADGENTIVVPGASAHVNRRLEDWLKGNAKLALVAATARYATAMNLRYSKISIRDQKTRWGSCSSSGELSYSWRLVLAPPFVLDYVAAHEVAHLAEMNHGPRFWRLVLTHCARASDAKRWLKAHGHDLHRFKI
jgi:predicted metal-dependent hydrolase